MLLCFLLQIFIAHLKSGVCWPSGEGAPKEEESFTSLPGAAGRDSSLGGYDPEEVLGCRAGDTVPALLLLLHPSG